MELIHSLLILHENEGPEGEEVEGVIVNCVGIRVGIIVGVDEEPEGKFEGLNVGELVKNSKLKIYLPTEGTSKSKLQ